MKFWDKPLSTLRPERIVSGGQTGVDRGALDAAIALAIPHGGWCPAGRLAEDGAIPPHYQLRELESKEYAVRTEQNVIDSDATLILHNREKLSGGTRLTHHLARKHQRPVLVLRLDDFDRQRFIEWLNEHEPAVLNVAGPRESSAPGIAALTENTLVNLWSARGG